MAIVTWIVANMTSIAVAAFLLVAAIVLFLFHSNIGRAIDRWNAPQGSTTPPGQDVVAAQGDTPRPGNFLNVIPDNEEAGARAAQLAVLLDGTAHTPEQKLTLALTELANKDLRLDCELAFRIIYGSQLDALRALRQGGPQPLATFYQQFLERVAAAYSESPPQREIDFETWVAFLTKSPHPFVRLDGGVATLTGAGAAFLSYVTNVISNPLPRPL